MTKINLKLLFVPSLVLIISLSIFYVFQIGSLTKEIYLIKDYEKGLDRLSKENEILEINHSKLDSLNNIENYLLDGNFVKTNAKQVKYIQILGSTVVTK